MAVHQIGEGGLVMVSTVPMYIAAWTTANRAPSRAIWIEPAHNSHIDPQQTNSSSCKLFCANRTGSEDHPKARVSMS